MSHTSPATHANLILQRLQLSNDHTGNTDNTDNNHLIALTRALLVLIGEVFENEHVDLTDAYIQALLERRDLWIVAALRADNTPIGGLIAHRLPMTRGMFDELFIYDIAVDPAYQRQGIGRQLMTYTQDEAAKMGIKSMFVFADMEDDHALDFYRALGGEELPANMFTFGS